MSLDSTIMTMIERIRRDAGCEAEVRQLQGEVLQFKVTNGIDYRLAFRDGTVELDGSAEPTFHIQGDPQVFDDLFQRRLKPLAAIMTRRLKVTFDPVRMPLVRRIISVGLALGSQEEA